MPLHHQVTRIYDSPSHTHTHTHTHHAWCDQYTRLDFECCRCNVFKMYLRGAGGRAHWIWDLILCNLKYTIIVLKIQILNFKHVGCHYMKTLKRISTELLLPCFILRKSAQSVTGYLLVDTKQVIFKRFWRWCIILCGDGFMDFIHRPKSKILKLLKNLYNFIVFLLFIFYLFYLFFILFL
jgi:hypothetical protein